MNDRIFIAPTSSASARTRQRIREHGSLGFVDHGAAGILEHRSTPYSELDRTLFRAVSHPHWFGWIQNNEWEVSC